MKYSEKMTRNVCFAALTILILLIKTSGGAILSLSTGFPSCQGSTLRGTDPDKAGTLAFKYPVNYFCRWKVDKPTDAGEAVVLHVKKINIKGCPSTLQLPGTAKMCTRKEPFCYVYTSNGSYCTQSDVNQQVQASYSDCTTSQIYSRLTTMDLDYSPSGTNRGSKKFQIDFMRITCNKPPPTTIPSSSATTTKISAPISPRIASMTPATTTKKKNFGIPPVAVPTTSAEYLNTSGAKTTKASETTRATSNNVETGSGSTEAGFSGIATSTSNILSNTDDTGRDNVTNMFTTGTRVKPGNGIVTPGNGTFAPGNGTVTPGNATADAERTRPGLAVSKGNVNLAALLGPIFVILAAAAVGSGVIYFRWRRQKKTDSNN